MTKSHISKTKAILANQKLILQAPTNQIALDTLPMIPPTVPAIERKKTE